MTVQMLSLLHCVMACLAVEYTKQVITTKNKVFCSYAYTGEEKSVVWQRMEMICQTFKQNGIDTYCNLFDPGVEGFSEPKQYIDAALAELKKCDTVLIIMT